jgi:hypothetical protein
LSGAENAGGLVRREAEHVPEYEDRPLLGWQVLQARHELQGDRLLLVRRTELGHAAAAATQRKAPAPAPAD